MIIKQSTSLTIISHHNGSVPAYLWMKVVAFITQNMKFGLTCKYISGYFRPFCLNHSLKKLVFSFELFKQCTDCFSSTCELITMAGSNFLDGAVLSLVEARQKTLRTRLWWCKCKTYCGVGGWLSENHTYLLKAYVLKIFFIHSYLKRHIWK